MDKTEKIQKLHLAKAQGQKLSVEDESELKNWYAMLDEEESVINRKNKKVDAGSLKKKIVRTTEQIVAMSGEMTEMLKQNEQIRIENQQLRRQIESRLVEQAA